MLAALKLAEELGQELEKKKKKTVTAVEKHLICALGEMIRATRVKSVARLLQFYSVKNLNLVVELNFFCLFFLYKR